MTIVDTRTGEARLHERIEKTIYATSLSDRTSADSHVYFIQQGNSGPIKIGRAVDVVARIQALQTASPEPLTLLGVVIYGGPRMEARLHRMFAADRLLGEWFAPTDYLYEVIADLGWAA